MERAFQEELIRKGAEAELVELRSRMGKLEALLGRGPRPGRSATPNGNGVVRRRRKMSAAAKAIVSQRMKAYWAARRAGAKK